MTNNNEHLEEIVKELKIQNAYTRFDKHKELEDMDYEDAKKELKDTLDDIAYDYDYNYAYDYNKEYSTNKERFFGGKSAIDTKNFEVQTLVNEVITTMFNGFEKGERNTGMTKQIEKILTLVARKQITLNNGAIIAKQTGIYCKPPMNEEDVAQIWNSLMEKE